MKHYIDFHRDVSFEDLDYLLDTAIDLKAKTKAGIEHHLLKGKSLAMIFTKSSTRTRVSFEVGMYQLGGQALFLSNNDIQIGRGETIYDTANVLSGMVDGIMIRTFKHQAVEDLANYGKIPVINGLTDDQHPTQVLADLLTIKEHKAVSIRSSTSMAAPHGLRKRIFKPSRFQPTRTVLPTLTQIIVQPLWERKH